jgi:endonuclease-3
MAVEICYLAEELEKRFGLPQVSSRKNALDSLILTILSQNTNDKNRDVAYSRLKERFPSWEMALEGGAGEIAEAIKPGGLSNQKAQRILQILRWLKQEYGELNLDFICTLPVDKAMDLLLSLKGVGVKTASVVLLFTCGQALFPIDTHIYRVLRRLGIIPLKATAEKAFYLLEDKIPRDKILSLHLNIIKFGRALCQARSPKCQQCFLNKQCPYFASKSEDILTSKNNKK